MVTGPAERVAGEAETLRRLGEELFSQWANSADVRLPNAPYLLLYNSRLAQSGFPAICDRTEVALRLAAGSAEADLEWGEFVVARSGTRSLPFQTDSFGAVFLCHMVSQGEEEELAEACRLVQPGGRLFILGLNRIGLRNLRGRSLRSVPAIRPLALRSRLEALDMSVLGLHGAGLLRREWPQTMSRGIARLFLPLADLFLIVAKPVEPKILNPLKKRKLRGVAAPSAVVGR